LAAGARLGRDRGRHDHGEQGELGGDAEPQAGQRRDQRRHGRHGQVALGADVQCVPEGGVSG
jgi:hypothetical protein